MSKNTEKSGSASLTYLTKEGFRNIRSNKLMSLASIAVLMSCLVLIGVASLLFVNINIMLGDISQQNVIMVYIQDDATDEQIEQMGAEIQGISNVATSTFIPKEEAFPEVMESIGTAAALFEGMESDLLPDAYEVTLKDMELYDETVSSLEQLDNIIQLRHNRDFAQQLTTLRTTAGYISIAVIAMLLVVSLFIISNTVRVTMYNRRLEIRIMKSVGATKWFIRWPFIVEGIVLGVIAGVVSLAIVFGIYEAGIKAVGNMLSILSSKPAPFADYALNMLVAFVATGVITGAIGSIVSMNKYLKEQDYDSDNVSE
ncbi:MAG: permease-like cell division protein FtsX [Clostridia bacterium]|nr:permease-like cell division protein FtsX [Clostridia bacterium]MBR6619458.1 permease-like cell division protein FtsX [Clostridia bacterium]